MTEKRLTSTKALSAYLKTRHHTSLSAAAARCGLDQSTISGETISDDIAGRIARLYGLAPENLDNLISPYA